MARLTRTVPSLPTPRVVKDGASSRPKTQTPKLAAPVKTTLPPRGPLGLLR